MKIGGFGELENLRRSISRDNSSKVNKSAEGDSAKSGSSDEVQLSDQAKVLGKLNKTPDVRQEKINEIKEQVESGEYLTQDKVASGIRGMLGGL
ncbi:MAG: flagellar biosynthesis anti-sigma factor FlgM [Planctomycetota bacterium]|jgi:flagellar biosynthesis anti-sigma factor FlgM